MDLDDMIIYGNETTWLDYKLIQYLQNKHCNAELLKDIIAMANAHVTRDRYIVCGVKHKAGKNEIIGIDKDKIIDDAIYQDLIKENITPLPQIEYFPYEVKGMFVCIFKISCCNKRPYTFKKGYGKYNAGESRIRRGSATGILKPEDYEMIANSNNSIYSTSIKAHKIDIGFEENGKHEIKINPCDTSGLPSDVEAEKIREEIDKKKPSETMPTGFLPSLYQESIAKSMNQFANAQQSWVKAAKMSLRFHPQVHGEKVNKPYQEQSLEELEESLNKVKDEFKSKDDYELFENRSYKLNFDVSNNTGSFLNDCEIQVKIPQFYGLIVLEEEYYGPYGFANMLISNAKSLYPNVQKDNDYFYVTERIGNLNHYRTSKAFEKKLRLIFGETLVGQTLEFEVSLYAKELPEPVIKRLSITII